MKTVGLVGGIGPESTVEYYRFIIESYRAHIPDGSYPSIIINSINLKQLIDWMNANQLDELTDKLVDEVERLAVAGADFAAFASNTPHLVFDAVQRRSRIPMLSIVEAACERARQLNFNRVGLLGTRFTMRGNFYPKVFSREGIALIVPDEEDQAYIHDKYMNELLNNVFLPETRDRMVEIANDLKTEKGIQALILGGTELPLLLRDAEWSLIPLLDTTRIHVDRIVSEMVSGNDRLE